VVGHGAAAQAVLRELRSATPHLSTALVLVPLAPNIDELWSRAQPANAPDLHGQCTPWRGRDPV